jgi:cytochrome c
MTLPAAIFRAGILASALAALAISPAWAAEDLGDADRGKSLFQQCAACHQVGPGAEHGIGPHLNGVFGRRAGTMEGFRYSRSIVRMGAGGLEWHLETLSPYIENPRALVSGTRMSFRGIANPSDRADVIAYLRSFSASPRDIPEADPTATPSDHSLDPAIVTFGGDPEYGAYLSSECTTCHQAEGGDEGIPSIVYWPQRDFVVALQAYKRKTRPHPVMQMIAGRLSDEEIAALAAYFENPTP